MWKIRLDNDYNTEFRPTGLFRQVYTVALLHRRRDAPQTSLGATGQASTKVGIRRLYKIGAENHSSLGSGFQQLCIEDS